MVDNVKVNPSLNNNAVSVATDEVAGIHYPIYKLTGETPTQFAYVDEFSGAVGIIEQEHLKIHEGKLFTVSSILSITNAGGVKNVLGVNPVLSFPHFRNITVTADGGPFDIELFEDTVVSANGALITSYNNNRNSILTPSLTVYDGPTITSDGTLLETTLVTGTKQAGSFGTNASNEWDLKPSSNYMIRITNNTAGGGTTRFAINMFWYE